MTDDDLEFLDEDDSALLAADTASFSETVLYPSDWTVETILSQLENTNIDLNPRFQRRDAWGLKGKSRFIESVMLGFPIPQIVLAEKKGQRGKFIVLDGKQRLLTLLQFTGRAEGGQNGFALSGLEARSDLLRKRFSHLQSDPNLAGDLNGFLNNTIRTVVIRNWPNTAFLHLVFLRLNTGSVKLSPQELRQAMVPGPFSNFVDDTALASPTLRTLLSRSTPDPRMRDVELLVRYLAFRRFLPTYTGRMKEFLDVTCQKLNDGWPAGEVGIREDLTDFDLGVEALIAIFTKELLARKPNSRPFNRAIFDVLIFYASDQKIRDAMVATPEAVKEAYAVCLRNDAFMDAVESDTAGIPHTQDRLAIWGSALRDAIKVDFNLPELMQIPEQVTRIAFNGLR